MYTEKRAAIQVKENLLGDLELTIIEKQLAAQVETRLKEYWGNYLAGSYYNRCHFYLQEEAKKDFFWAMVNNRKKRAVSQGFVETVWINYEVLGCLSCGANFEGLLV